MYNKISVITLIIRSRHCVQHFYRSIAEPAYILPEIPWTIRNTPQGCCVPEHILKSLGPYIFVRRNAGVSLAPILATSGFWPEHL